MSVSKNQEKYYTDNVLSHTQAINKAQLDDESDDDQLPDLHEDGLLLANAYHNDIEHDKVDKSRYVKETVTYITINSANRTIVPYIDFPEDSLDSTGPEYQDKHIVYPYTYYIEGDEVKVRVTNENFHIWIRVIDSDNGLQLRPAAESTYYDAVIPLGVYRLDDLIDSLTSSFNRIFGTPTTLLPSTSAPIPIPLNPQFTIIGTVNPVVNPDRLQLEIIINDPYKFTAYWVSDTVVWYGSNANSYEIELDIAFTNVKCLRIVDCLIPRSEFIIDSTNNFISVIIYDGQLSIASTTFQLTVGQYTLDNFLINFQNQLNDIVLDMIGYANFFTITRDLVTGLLEIATSSPYKFMLTMVTLPHSEPSAGYRNLYQMLGFPQEAPLIPVKKFTNLINVNGSLQVYSQPNWETSKNIWININGYESIYNSLNRTYYFAQCFVNPPVPDYGGTFDLPSTTLYSFVQSPLPNLRTLKISLFDQYGNPYPFNGLEHQFTLEVTCYYDKVMGADIGSHRGIPDHTSYDGIHKLVV